MPPRRRPRKAAAGLPALRPRSPNAWPQTATAGRAWDFCVHLRSVDMATADCRFVAKRPSLTKISPVHSGMTTDRRDIHGLADRLSGLIREIRGFPFSNFGCGSAAPGPFGRTSFSGLGRSKLNCIRLHSADPTRPSFVILNAAKNPSGCLLAIVALDSSLRSE
jgi:hypothetical protein